VFPQLHTERLLLRELRPDDAPALLAIHADTDHMRWYGADPLATPDDAARLVELYASWRRMPNPGARWGIVRQSDGALIGTCGLFKWNRVWRRCTTGYELAAAEQGRGYMREALTAVFAYGFDEMALNRIDASVHPNNAASLRTLSRFGFTREGYTREAGFWGGMYHDLLELGLLRRDFHALPGRPGAELAAACVEAGGADEAPDARP
jgi:[ribosomal protein S5]-alanine N-acetyltransferase